jgi:ribose 5-phosphate isomerase B
MKIVLGSDHAGVQLKEEVKQYLKRKSISFEDVGTASSSSVDYPDFAKKVAKKVASGKANRGILICGTGTGMVIAANRFKKVRAVAAYDTYTAKMSREHNNANVLCLRARKFPHKKVKGIISVWLTTPFSGNARHKRRVRKLDTK